MKNHHFLQRLILISMLLSGCDFHGHEHIESEEQHQESMTLWDAGLELYIKFNTPVAGLSQPWEVYLTKIPNHEPLSNASLKLQFQAKDGVPLVHEITEPNPRGSFTTEVVLPKAGEYHLSLIMTTAQGDQIMNMGTLNVEASKSSSNQHSDLDDVIFFPKLQQWHIPFATSVVREDLISPKLLVPTMVESIPEKYVRLLMPVAGLIGVADDASWPTIGMTVIAGQPLAKILPVTGAEDMGQLELQISQANERYKLAMWEIERVRGLHKQGIVADRRIEQAEAEARLARETFQRLVSQRDLLLGKSAIENPALVLRAPINGEVVNIELAPGEVGRAGDRLFTILDDSRVRLKAQIFPADMQNIDVMTEPLLHQPSGKWEKLDQVAPGLLLRTIDARDGSVSFLIDVDNSNQKLITGSRLSIAFRTAKPERHVVVPASAVVDDDGVSVVIVQIEGEVFQRRVVRTGVRALGRVAILDGLAAGERIVTLGAYTALLAARDARVDIGHSH